VQITIAHGLGIFNHEDSGDFEELSISITRSQLIRDGRFSAPGHDLVDLGLGTSGPHMAAQITVGVIPTTGRAGSVMPTNDAWRFISTIRIRQLREQGYDERHGSAVRRRRARIF